MSSTTKEVVTLQFGHYANFVGTHVWNIQESSFCYGQTTDGATISAPKEIDNDVLYREGRTLLGDVTYTPRLIAVDLKGSLNTLRPDGVLYELHSELDDITWGGDVTMHEASPTVKNEFLTDLDISENLLHKGHPEDDGPEDKETEEEATSSRQTVPSIKDKQYHLDNSIAVWSDYLYGHLHPKSLSIIREYTHQRKVTASLDLLLAYWLNEEDEGGYYRSKGLTISLFLYILIRRNESEMFELYPQGKDLVKKRSISDELEDKLHFFTEECDHLQGFQMITNFDDGFSGMSSGLLEMLADDYPGKGIFTVGVHPAMLAAESTARQDNYRIINSALAFDQFTQHSSLFLPISLNSTLWRKLSPALTSPYLAYDASLDYHSSAILASCMDTASLPYRMKNDALTISGMCDMLNNGDRKIGTLCSSYPFPLPESKPLITTLQGIKDTSFLRPLAANTGHGTHIPYSQLVVSRGIPNTNLKGSTPHPQNPFEHGKSADEMMKMLVANLYPNTVSSLLSVTQAIPTTTPYPHIFSPQVTRSGLIGDKPRQSTEAVRSIPMVTSLQSSPASGHMLISLVNNAKKIDLRKHHGYFENNMEEDEYQEILDNLYSLSQRYGAGAIGSSDDDD